MQQKQTWSVKNVGSRNETLSDSMFLDTFNKIEAYLFREKTFSM